MRIVVPIVLALLAASCASSLQTYSATNVEQKGIQVRTPVLAQVTRVSSYSVVANADVKYCKPDTSVTLEVLPIGAMYQLNFDPSWLGKSEFKVELTDAGLLKAVALNSDPKVAEVAKELSSLIGTVLPYVAAPKPSEARAAAIPPGNETASELRDKNCIRSSVRIVEFKVVQPAS